MTQERNGDDGRSVATNRNAVRDAVANVLQGQSQESLETITDGILANITDTQTPAVLNGLHTLTDDAARDAAQTISTMVRAELAREANGAANGNGSNGYAGGDQAASPTSALWSASEEQEPALSPNSRAILENRYLARDANNQITEDPRALFERVANAIAEGERAVGTPEPEIGEWARRYYRLMASLRFLPNSPTLVNAGKDGRGSLSACFVVSPQDDMGSIMKVASDAAMIEKWGGGIGFGFSNLRPKGDPIATTHGMACGPVAVMKLYSAVGATLTQGAFRLGAHMGQLNISHPDVLEFIHSKDDDLSLQNFNISVQVTDEFMRAVEADGDWDLISPHNGQVTQTVSARDLWGDICNSAWKTGDPGLVFMDRVWDTQPNPQLGLIETSNPCGEEFLENYGNCCLGSIDVAKHLNADNTDFDWAALDETVRTAIRFLDDVIEVNTFPVAELREMNLKTRRVGLGIMGWAGCSCGVDRSV